MPRFFGGRGCLCRASPLFRGDFAFFRVAARTAALPFRFAGVRTFPKRLGDQPLPAGDPLSGRLSPTFGALFWLMKIIKTRFLDFSEGDSIFFEKSHFKIWFSFHRKYENFSEFYNLRQMSVDENHEIYRENSDPAHDFCEAIRKKWMQTDIAAHLRKSEVHKNTLVK